MEMPHLPRAVLQTQAHLDVGWPALTPLYPQWGSSAMGITNNWLQCFPPLELQVLFPTGCCCCSALHTPMLRHKGDKQHACLRVAWGTAQEWKVGPQSPSASFFPTTDHTEQLNAPYFLPILHILDWVLEQFSCKNSELLMHSHFI